MQCWLPPKTESSDRCSKQRSSKMGTCTNGTAVCFGCFWPFGPKVRWAISRGVTDQREGTPGSQSQNFRTPTGWPEKLNSELIPETEQLLCQLFVSIRTSMRRKHFSCHPVGVLMMWGPVPVRCTSGLPAKQAKQSPPGYPPTGPSARTTKTAKNDPKTAQTDGSAIGYSPNPVRHGDCTRRRVASAGWPVIGWARPEGPVRA